MLLDNARKLPVDQIFNSKGLDEDLHPPSATDLDWIKNLSLKEFDPTKQLDPAKPKYTPWEFEDVVFVISVLRSAILVIGVAGPLVGFVLGLVVGRISKR